MCSIHYRKGVLSSIVLRYVLYCAGFTGSKMLGLMQFPAAVQPPSLHTQNTYHDVLSDIPLSTKDGHTHPPGQVSTPVYIHGMALDTCLLQHIYCNKWLLKKGDGEGLRHFLKIF